MSLSDFLSAVPLFSGLSSAQMDPFQEKLEVLKFVRDAFICKEGEKADSMFVIKSGIVQIFCDDGHSDRKILTHLKLGDYFGEMSLLTEEPRTASAVAMAETEVIRIRKDDFSSLLKSAPEIALTVIRTLCERLAKANAGNSAQKKCNVFAVMGPDNSSGKSLFARNLALAMQNVLGKTVFLLDPNIRNERVARHLGITRHSRIIDELVEKERISDLNKYVVKTPCGLSTLLPQENGLTDLRLKEFHTFALMKTIFENFEFVVIDSSSMFTKVTKEIVQSADKIVYLMSSRNVSISGLIDHFEETRRGWRVDPAKVIYGVNHNTNDPKQESVITEKAYAFLKFELPFLAELAGRQEADQQLLVQRSPEVLFAQTILKQAEDLMFDQVISLFLPAFSEEPAKASLARRWAETGVAELTPFLRQVCLKEGVVHDGQSGFLVEGRAAKWSQNTQVPAVIDFASRFKKEFDLQHTTLLINGQANMV